MRSARCSSATGKLQASALAGVKADRSPLQAATRLCARNSSQRRASVGGRAVVHIGESPDAASLQNKIEGGTGGRAINVTRANGEIVSREPDGRLCACDRPVLHGTCNIYQATPPTYIIHRQARLGSAGRSLGSRTTTMPVLPNAPSVSASFTEKVDRQFIPSAAR